MSKPITKLQTVRDLERRLRNVEIVMMALAKRAGFDPSSPSFISDLIEAAMTTKEPA